MKRSSPRPVRRISAARIKLTVVVCLLAIGMLLWGRLLLKARMPRTALAAPPTAMPAAFSTPAQDAPATGRGPAVLFEGPVTLERDPFALDPSRYIRIGPPEPEVHVAAVEKLPGQTPDVSHEGEAMRQAVGLKLQSTLLGSDPRAVINGQVLTLGQKIRGFVLRQIRAREVVLEIDGVDVRLEM